MRVELIRHGLTASNLERRYPDRMDEPLCAMGREMIAEAGCDCSLVYATKLLRTQETAAILFPKASLVIRDGLEEMDFGRFGGKTSEELAMDPEYASWVESGCESTCPDGENKKLFCARVTAAFDDLITEACGRGEEEVRIVCHGGTIMAVMERYAFEKRDYFSWNRPCGCGYLLEAADWKNAKKIQILGLTDYRVNV